MKTTTTAASRYDHDTPWNLAVDVTSLLRDHARTGAALCNKLCEVSLALQFEHMKLLEEEEEQPPSSVSKKSDAVQYNTTSSNEPIDDSPPPRRDVEGQPHHAPLRLTSAVSQRLAVAGVILQTNIALIAQKQQALLGAIQQPSIPSGDGGRGGNADDARRRKSASTTTGIDSSCAPLSSCEMLSHIHELALILSTGESAFREMLRDTHTVLTVNRQAHVLHRVLPSLSSEKEVTTSVVLPATTSARVGPPNATTEANTTPEHEVRVRVMSVSPSPPPTESSPSSTDEPAFPIVHQQPQPTGPHQQPQPPPVRRRLHRRPKQHEHRQQDGHKSQKHVVISVNQG